MSTSPSLNTPISQHPFGDLDECYNLRCKKPLDLHRPSWQTWLIRTVHKLCRWSGDFYLEDMGTFTDLTVAVAIAAQKNSEAQERRTGDVWEVVPSPVNRIPKFERLHVQPTAGLVDCQAVREIKAEYKKVDAEVDRTLAMAKRAAAVL